MSTGTDEDRRYFPPRECPVCGAGLRLTRLGCGTCGSELSGVFESCAFCALTEADRDLLRVFLVSRGNMRELERHLGVSYPTARQRYAEVLVKLGLEPAGRNEQERAEPTAGREAERAPGRDGAEAGQDAQEQDARKTDRVEILTRLARGELDVESATHLLRAAE